MELLGLPLGDLHKGATGDALHTVVDVTKPRQRVVEKEV